MLVDVILRPDPQMSAFLKIMKEVMGSQDVVVRLAKGVYESYGGNFDHEIGLRGYDNQYPKLTRKKTAPTITLPTGAYVGGENLVIDEGGDYFGPYGVCDNWQQVTAICAQLDPSDPTPYCLAVAPIHRANEPESGGWRWHKWGEYIGTQTPTTEYIHDEPLIETVYCYHVYLLPPEFIDNSGQYDQKKVSE